MSSFKEFEQKAWERKANLYDDNWGAVTRQVSKRIIEIANLKPGRKLLDLGCGPGHLCNEAFEKGAEVIGADLSNNMIEIAKKNYPNISFQSQDAECLSFGDETFDVVTLNYLLLHVPDQKKVLLEVRRVLKKGGLLIFTLWKEPPESPALKLIFDGIKSYADTSLIPAADDIFQFSRKVTAEKFFETSGFSHFNTETSETAWKCPSTESFFNSVLSGTRMGGTIEIQSHETREKNREKIFVELEGFRVAAGFVVPMPSVICWVTKD